MGRKVISCLKIILALYFFKQSKTSISLCGSVARDAWGVLLWGEAHSLCVFLTSLQQNSSFFSVSETKKILWHFISQSFGMPSLKFFKWRVFMVCWSELVDVFFFCHIRHLASPRRLKFSGFLYFVFVFYFMNHRCTFVVGERSQSHIVSVSFCPQKFSSASTGSSPLPPCRRSAQASTSAGRSRSAAGW